MSYFRVAVKFPGLRRFSALLIFAAGLALAPVTALAQASISISTVIPPYPSVDFGLVAINAPPPQNHSDASFTITNNGTELLWSFNISIDRPQFTLLGHTCGSNFFPGQTCTVNLRYTPTVSGENWFANLSVGFYPLPYLYPVQLYAKSYTIPAPIVPGQPTIGTATPGNYSAVVNFSGPAPNGGSAISSFVVTSNPAGGSGSCTAPVCTVSGLTPGVPYTFTVAAVNSAGMGPVSAPSNPVTPGPYLPSAPIIGTAFADGGGRAIVYFSPPVNNGGVAVTSYTVTSSPAGATVNGAISPVLVTGLVPGTPYTFKVRANNVIGAGPQSASSNEVVPASGVFPPLTSLRSDFLNSQEGSAASPLQIALGQCVAEPPVEFQDWMCPQPRPPLHPGDPPPPTPPAQSVPTVYGATNSYSTTANPYFAWIISRNNEFYPNVDCSTGPPNQSHGPNDYPFSLSAASDSLALAVTHHSTSDFCGKAPYMSATYIRGVQGDPKAYLYNWQELTGKRIRMLVATQRQPDLEDTKAWFRVLLHFRNPLTGARYIVNQDYVMQDSRPTGAFNWNWPYLNSFQFPGARLVIPARVPTPQGAANVLRDITLYVDATFREYFPALWMINPDFLGVEIGVEIGDYPGISMSMDIKSIWIE